MLDSCLNSFFRGLRFYGFAPRLFPGRIRVRLCKLFGSCLRPSVSFFKFSGFEPRFVMARLSVKICKLFGRFFISIGI